MKRLLCVLLFAMVLLLASVAYAFEGISAKTYLLPAGETHRGDLAVDAHQAVIEGTVDGDLYVFAESVQVKGHVTGDVLSFAANTVISGTVEGNVRSFTQYLTITGTVQKSVTTGSHHVMLGQTGYVGTNMLLFAANVDLEGKVAREVNGLIDALRISGHVNEGTSLLKCRSLRLDAPASIGGDLTYLSPERAVISPGVVLKGNERFSPLMENPVSEHFSFIPIVLLGFSSFLCTLLVWLTVRFLFPAGICGIHHQFDKKQGKMFGWGAALVFGIPVLALILLITVVGIPVGLTLILVYLLFTWGAKVFVGSWLGLRVVARMKWPIPALLAELFGVMLLQCLLFIPLVGWFFALPVWIAFLGALATCVQKTNKAILR